MARIRTIKPEFWTSEQVVECSPIARLLFIGLWNFCDDGGNHPASAKSLKMLVFPGDDFSVSDVEKMVGELVVQGLLADYQGIDGKKYWHVTGWHHQKIEKPSFKYPKFGDHSATIRRPFDDHSAREKEKEKEVLSSSSSSAHARDFFEKNGAAEFVFPPVAPHPPPESVIVGLLGSVGGKIVDDFSRYADRIAADDGEISALCRRAKVPDKPLLLDYLASFVGFKQRNGDPPPRKFEHFRTNFENWIPGERKKRESETREAEKLPPTIIKNFNTVKNIHVKPKPSADEEFAARVAARAARPIPNYDL